MSEVLTAKIIKIGTSFGILIPKRAIKENKMKLGEEVEVALLKRKRLEEIERAFGIFKGAGPFVREKEDREVDFQ